MQNTTVRKGTFPRRTGGFLRAAALLALHPGDLWRLFSGRRVPRPLAEKIMLAVTQVNGCRYCNYFHSHQALRAGVRPQEIRQLMMGELGDFPAEQAVALTFAQHYAEASGRPSPEAWNRLVEFYGPAKARDIRTVIRTITVGNLLGNNFDLLLYRLGRISLSRGA